jgi:beta-carotene 3-hydroxylase
MSPAWLIFVAWALAAFIGMELLSYILHRWVFHGILWKIHITHHTKRHGLFEANDFFSFFFTGLAILLLAIGVFDPFGHPAFAIGTGMTLYGILYFIIHDLMTHRRFWPLSPPVAWIDVIRRAHLAHHQSAEKQGREPFGLFLFPYQKFRMPARRRNQTKVEGEET